MEETDVLAAARAAIQEFGDSAHRAMERRAEAHQRASELDGEQFWRRVAEAVRVLLPRGSKIGPHAMIQVNAAEPGKIDTEQMSASFHTAALAGDEIFQAYPLVQATYPNVDLESWKNFAKFFAERENCGVLALKDTVDCICGVVAYQLDWELNLGLVLAVHLFTTADLMSSSRTVQALLDAAEKRAASLGCNGLQIRLSGNQIKLGSRLSALGLSSGAGLFCKTVASRPRVN